MRCLPCFHGFRIRECRCTQKRAGHAARHCNEGPWPCSQKISCVSTTASHVTEKILTMQKLKQRADSIGDFVEKGCINTVSMLDLTVLANPSTPVRRSAIDAIRSFWLLVTCSIVCFLLPACFGTHKQHALHWEVLRKGAPTGVALTAGSKSGIPWRNYRNDEAVVHQAIKAA